MAWIEQTGKCSWRVRYPRPAGGYGSVSGFSSRKTTQDYTDDVESDRRRGQWLDPDGAKTTVAAWATRWVETFDVETRTEENYRAYLRNHILPTGNTRHSARSPRWRSVPGSSLSAGATRPRPWPGS
jgi:hypothetical protein